MSIRTNKFLIGSEIDLRDMVYYKNLNFSYFLYFSFHLIKNIFLKIKVGEVLFVLNNIFLKLYLIDLDYNDIIYKVTQNLIEIENDEIFWF